MTGFLIVTALVIATMTGCSSVSSDYVVSTSMKFSADDTPMVTVVPDYPRMAVSQKMEGSVAMSFLVGNTGEVVDILVLDSPGEPFESAAVKALEQTVYDSSFSGKGFVAIAEFTLSDRNIY